MADTAQGIIRSTLDRYGLGTLATWAWEQYQGGNSIEEILFEMRSRPEYKDRFPAMEDLAKAGRALSEEEYISYEVGLRNLVNQFGLPMELYGTRSFAADMLLSDVSIAEAQNRMQLASAASTTIPTEYRTELNRLYGVTANQLVSYWLDPDRTLPYLERQFATATVAGEVTMSNLGQLSQTMAERLVDAGISREQARQGLTRASQELGARLPGEVEAGLGTDTLVAGALGVGEAAQAFERRVRQRIAAFAAGGSAVTTTEGAVGLGKVGR